MVSPPLPPTPPPTSPALHSSTRRASALLRAPFRPAGGERQRAVPSWHSRRGTRADYRDVGCSGLHDRDSLRWTEQSVSDVNKKEKERGVEEEGRAPKRPLKRERECRVYLWDLVLSWSECWNFVWVYIEGMGISWGGNSHLLQDELRFYAPTESTSGYFWNGKTSKKSHDFTVSHFGTL